MQFRIDDEKLFIDDKEFYLENINFIKELGAGANARVFLALNTWIDRYEAIKIWLPRKNQRQVDINRFKAEIQKNAVFQSRYIVSIYDANRLNGIFYCRMQYILGVTLRDYLSLPRPFMDRYNYLHQILDILIEVYELGYFHGDLHGGNVMLNREDDHAYLIDFGTSVFSGKEISHNRDAKMLFELTYNILPEMEKLIYIDNSIIEQGSKVVGELFVNAMRLLWFLESKDVYDCDDITLMENMIFPLENFLDEYPFIDKKQVALFYQRLRVNETAYRGVNLRTIQNGLNLHKYLSQ